MVYTNLCTCCGTMFCATDWDICPKCGGDSSNIIVGSFKAYFENEWERNTHIRNAHICTHVNPIDLRKAIGYCYPNLSDEKKEEIYNFYIKK